MLLNIVTFNGEELLVPRLNSKLEYYSLPAVRGCLFRVFAATLHVWKPFLYPSPHFGVSKQKEHLVWGLCLYRLSVCPPVCGLVSATEPFVGF